MAESNVNFDDLCPDCGRRLQITKISPSGNGYVCLNCIQYFKSSAIYSKEQGIYPVPFGNDPDELPLDEELEMYEDDLIITGGLIEALTVLIDFSTHTFQKNDKISNDVYHILYVIVYYLDYLRSHLKELNETTQDCRDEVITEMDNERKPDKNDEEKE